MGSTSDIKDRTLVFTLPKGARASYSDFAPVISSIQGQFVAFGTVGVGHVWHMTFYAPELAESFLQGHTAFCIGDRQTPVEVTKYSELLNVGTIFWLPFWVPHNHIIQAIDSYLDNSQISCQYVTVPQRGYKDCYSTQRRIECTGSLKDLPYFVNVESEGKTYRGFVFIPGREALCFKCGLKGHMKSSCGTNVEVNPVAASQPVQEVIMKEVADDQTSNAPQIPPAVVQQSISIPVRPESSETDKELSNLMNNPAIDYVAMFSDLVSEASKQSEENESDFSEIDKMSDNYLIKYTKADGSKAFVSRKGQPISVNPPKEMQIDGNELEKLLLKCTEKRCGLLRVWEDEKIGHHWMAQHMRASHKSFAVVKDNQQALWDG